MRVELKDAAEASGIEVTVFVEDWMNRSKELLLECHRSGKPYEEVLATWTIRVNSNDE